MKWFAALLVFGGGIILLLVSACSRNIENQSHTDFFDLEGLIDSQVITLSSNNYGIQKLTKLGSEEDMFKHYPDSAGWAKELDIIKTANINKPGLSPYYNLLTQDSSVYLIDTYVLNDTGRSSTLYQKIYRSKKSRTVNKIKIKQQTDNPIYHSDRNIEVLFKQQEEDVIIDSIIVNGYQKIIFLDTAFYQSISRTIQK